MKAVFLYVLHSGNLYGTERMALVTLDGLRDRFRPVLFAPPGAALEAAGRMNIETVSFDNARALAISLRRWIADNHRIVFAATGVIHSLLFIGWNAWYRRECVHLHLVHGGTDERQSYARKRILNPFGVRVVAVSEFVRSRLIHHGVRPQRVRVCENFLPDLQIDSAPRRPAFGIEGVRNIIMVSRIDPIKRVDLLLDCLDRHPELANLRFRIFGTGWDLDQLRDRASRSHPNVMFQGYSTRIAEAMARSDLLLHLCPVEPFGLVVLEAMAAGIPVLVPNSGGAVELIEPGVSGFHFRADDPDALAGALTQITAWSPTALNRVVMAASQRLRSRYSSFAGLESYRKVLGEFGHE